MFTSLCYHFDYLPMSRTDRCSSPSYTARGATRPFRYLRYAFWLKPTSMHPTSSNSCKFSLYLVSCVVPYDRVYKPDEPDLTLALSRRCSADLDITVQLLVQIDKLVQLIESPVFTCEYFPSNDTACFRFAK